MILLNLDIFKELSVYITLSRGELAIATLSWMQQYINTVFLLDIGCLGNHPFNLKLKFFSSWLEWRYNPGETIPALIMMALLICKISLNIVSKLLHGFSEFSSLQAAIQLEELNHQQQLAKWQTRFDVGSYSSNLVQTARVFSGLWNLNLFGNKYTKWSCCAPWIKF